MTFELGLMAVSLSNTHENVDNRERLVRPGKILLMRAFQQHILSGQEKAARELSFRESVTNGKLRRMEMLPNKESKSKEQKPADHYEPSEAISKSLRYFSVRNRSDGTQFAEEREITLRRSLFDSSRKLDLAVEDDRLKTYDKWRYEKIVTPEQLAARGFSYLGDGDRVQCVFCKGVLRDWRQGDDALKEHHKHFPTCPFILHLDVGNVPKKQPYGNLKIGTPCTANRFDEYEPCLTTHDVSASMAALNVHQTNLQLLKEGHPLPKSSVVERLNSFRDENGVLPSYSVYAAVFAGFFLDTEEPMDTDTEDVEMIDIDDSNDAPAHVVVLCYACDVRIHFRKVIPNQIAAWWENHAKASRHCAHVRLHCGPDYGKRFTNLNSSVINTNQQLLIAGTRRHRVEPREVRARLDLPLYVELQNAILPQLQSISQCRELLSYLIDQRLEISGKDFETVEDAFKQLISYVDEYILRTSEFPEMTVTKYLNEKKEEIERQREELQARSRRAQLSLENSFKNSTNPLIDMDDEQLSEFNRQLKDNRTCKICMDHPVNTVFLPCGHLVTCHECAPKVKLCPVCRLPITSTVLTSI